MSFGRTRRWALLPAVALGALLIPVVAAAQAEPRSLEIPAAATWQHAETGLTLGPNLSDYWRTALVDNGDAELDVIATFAAADGSSVLSLFLFRPALMSVPVWFDRSETQILLRDVYQDAQPAGEARAFAPPSSSVASGLRRIYVTGAENERATALAVMPLGDWLVVVRMGTREADPAALDVRLDAVIAALGWPANVAEGEPASLIAPCAAPLEYARRAKLQRPSMTSALMGSVLLGLSAEHAEDNSDEDSRPVTFCRDTPGTVDYGVYRDAADQDRRAYIIALGDAGRTISLSPSLNELLGERKSYTLSFSDLDRVLIFPDFDKLASPDRALETVTSTSPISSTERGSSTINISGDAQ